MTVLVIGEGIAGLATALELLEREVPVRLITSFAGAASESSARRAGFDAAFDDDDDPDRHARELGTPSLLPVCEAARGLFLRLSRLGIPFAQNRARSLGASRARTAHVGAATAHHVRRRLSARLRHFGCERREGWDFTRLVLDDEGRARGVLVRERRTGKAEAIAASGVCLATGGYAGLFDPLHPARGRGAALGAVFRQGAPLELSGGVSFEIGYDAGGIPRALPEVLFANGASLFAGEDRLSWDPEATSFHELALRIGEGAELSLAEADPSLLVELVGGALNAIQDHAGIDPLADRLVVRPLPARALGGLGVESGEATGIPGLYAVGGASARHHREKALAGTALLSNLFAARSAAEKIAAEHVSQKDEMDPELARLADERWRDRRERARSAEGESPFRLRRELAQLLGGAPDLAALDELRDRLAQASCPDADLGFSPALSLLVELEDALLLARAVVMAGAVPSIVRCNEDGELERMDPT